ncbi:MAG: single-stranded DNA-binding protein [Verrucomicrobiota bacterium]
MADLNKVFLIGNLTRDPEMRQINDRSSVTKMGLAINRRFTTRSGEDREETTFVDVEVWGRQAEACNQYLRKGAPAFVEGRLTLDQWEDQNGQRRSRLYVTGERVQFLGSPSRGAGFQEQGGNQYGGASGGYAPQGPQAQPQQQQYQPPQAPQQPPQQAPQQQAPQPPPQQQQAPPPQQPPPPPQQQPPPPPQNQMPKFEEDEQESVQDDIPF